MTPAAPRQEAPRLLSLAGVFTRYTNLTFGGGSATIAVLRDQIVERRRWMTEPQFQLAYALSRLTPGTNVLAFCTAVGWMTRRWRGALIALLSASLPCSAIALVATHSFEVWQRYGAFRAALCGALAAAVAIMLNTAWVLVAPHVAVAGWLAMSTPALAIILLLRFIGPRAKHPRVQGMMQAVVLASAGLLVASALPLAQDAIVGPVTLTIAFVALALLVSRKVDTLWVIGGGAVVSLVSALLGVREIVAAAAP